MSKNFKCVGVKQTKLKRFSSTNQGVKLKTSIEKLAYNNAAKIYSEVDKKSFDYSKKQNDDFLKSELILPKNVTTNKTKFELFNELDKSYQNDLEAKIAMNYIISLPQELDVEVGYQIIKDYFQQQADKKQNFIDISLHLKNAGKQNANPHIHILEGRRAISKEGKLGKALHSRDVKDLMKLDNLEQIRMDIANLFNQALKNAAMYKVEYTHLSNANLVKQALENDDIELAIEKNYQTETVKKKIKTEKDHFLNNKYKNTKQRRMTLKQRIAKQKEEAEQYKQNKRELEQVKAKLNFYDDMENNVMSDYANKLQLNNLANSNAYKQRIVELLQNVEQYEQHKKEMSNHTKYLTVKFYKAMLYEKRAFKTKKEIRNFLKEVNKSSKQAQEQEQEQEKKKEYSLSDDDKDFSAAILAHKIFENIDEYVNKAQYYIVKEQKEADKILYNEIINKTNPTFKELLTVQKMEEKAKFENDLFKEAVEKAVLLKTQQKQQNDEPNLDFKEKLEIFIVGLVDSRAKSIQNEIDFSDVEKEVKKVELYNYISRNIDKMLKAEERAEHIKKSQEFNQLKRELKEQKAQVKAKDYMNKQVSKATEEVLNECDEVARLIYKYSNDVLNANFDFNNDLNDKLNQGQRFRI